MRTAFALYGKVAGIIERDAGRTTLRYLPGYIAQPDPTPLSLSVPVAPTIYPARPVKAYLKGLISATKSTTRRKAGPSKRGDQHD